MRVFDHPNTSANWKCPICGRNDDTPVVLVPVGEIGVEKSDLNILARQYHLECISLIDFKSSDLGMSGDKRVMTMIYTDLSGENNEPAAEQSKIHIP